MMYNEKIKIRYITEKNQEVILPNNYLQCQFNKVAELEKEYNKDVSNFTVYEIIEYYKMLNIFALESLITLNSQLSMYTQWCLQENLVVDNQNHFLEIKIDQLKSCLNKMLFNMTIIDRKTVLEWVDQLPNPKDQFVLLALFEGLKGKDFCELSKLRPEDVKGNVLHLCTGRTIQVSDKLLNIIRDCISEDTYYSISGKGTKKMPLVDKGYIVKDYPNARDDVSEFQIGRKIYNGIKRTLIYFDVNKFMSANTIAESGRLEMIKKRAKELGMSNKDYVYSDCIKEVEDRYDFKMVRSVFWVKYEDYLV